MDSSQGAPLMAPLRQVPPPAETSRPDRGKGKETVPPDGGAGLTSSHAVLADRGAAVAKAADEVKAAEVKARSTQADVGRDAKGKGRELSAEPARQPASVSPEERGDVIDWLLSERVDARMAVRDAYQQQQRVKNWATGEATGSGPDPRPAAGRRLAEQQGLAQGCGGAPARPRRRH